MLRNKPRYINILQDIIYIACLALLGYVFFKLFGWMIVNLNGDYRTDIPTYIKILDDRPGTFNRFVYVVFRFFINLAGPNLGINIFLTAEMLFICLCNHWYIRYYSEADISNPLHRFAVHLLSVAVIFMGPIYLPNFHEAFYKDTFPSFAWHSPTQQMMTLFSILATLSLFKLYDFYKERISVPWWIASSVLFFLSAYSKPSYIINVAPAIVIVFLIELAVKSDLSVAIRFKRLFTIGLSIVPAGLYVIWMYSHIYSNPENGDVVVALSNPNSSEGPNVIVALVCSLLFSIVVAFFNIKKISSDRRYLMILIIALVGFMQWFLLSESGWRAAHGNFSWGCTIGIYMLMLTCIGIFLSNTSDPNYLSDKRWLKTIYYTLASASLAMHVVSNVYYFYGMYNGLGFWR